MSSLDTASSAPTPTEPAPATSRRWLRVLVAVLLGLLWIRFVLFAWLFPLIERHVDNPEFNDTETSAPTDAEG